MTDPYSSDWKAHGLDYGTGKDAFHAANERRPEPPELTPEQKKAEAHRIAMLAKYHATQALKKASRVNKGDFHISTVEQTIAASDKRRKIVGASGGGR